MTVTFRCVAWAALDIETLYDLVMLRERVFVVEQRCIYQECDGADRDALHLLGHRDGELVAYARIFGPGKKHTHAAIGRVVIAPSARGGLGRALMEEAIRQTRSHCGPGPIHIGAQAHLQRFYGSLGFAPTSAPYDEDGIPHIDMTLP